MPVAASQSQPRQRLSLALVLVPALLLLVACGSDGSAPPSERASPSPSASPAALAMASQGATASLDDGAALCGQIAAVEERIAALRAVELRLPNRVALDIELGKLQAAFSQLAQADLGLFADQLEAPLTRLGYRLGEVELAVEDFRTDTRPLRAAPHVETDSRTFSEELSAFAILARC